MIRQDTNKFVSIAMPTVTNYTLRQDMDLKKDRWMHYPMQTGLAIYAYNYMEKNRRPKK